jgi:murein DD-endopeptidase MepM/ murein hydrolase activator NlpD
MSQRSSSQHRASDRYGHAYDGHTDDRQAEHPARRYAEDDDYGEQPAPDTRHARRIHTASRDDRQENRHEHREPRHQQHAPRPAARKDYTLGHAGRQVRIGPVAFWTCVGTLVIMAGWSAMTATYFAFHDDVLARLITRQAEMQFAYEDRIAEMRAQVDRVTSRQLLDQEQFERRLDQLAKRQATLESRASSLGALTDPNITGSIKPNARGAAISEPPATPLKPSPISDKVMFTAPPDREARLESRGTASTLSATRQVARMTSGGIEGVLSRLQDSLDRIESRQTVSLNTLEETYDGKVKRMRGVLADLGLNLGPRGSSDAPVGGPFVPYRLAATATAFERQIHRIGLARAQAEKLTRTMVAVPIRKPVMGDIDTTSGFGVRIDPFLGRPAMHTGLDFRGNTGEPIRATASGTVTVAGWSGGYGRMIEIDHGNGLSTRYGHLSQIDVTVGQSIKIGQIIGRLGSTGRSTGPHLHYETRINGEAVDPQKFLRAGIRMGSIQ